MASDVLRPGPLRPLAIIAIGIAGGAVCGFLIDLGLIAGIQPFSLGRFADALFQPLTAVLVGAPFGAIAFPICFYLFLSELPIRRTFLVTTYCTVIFGWMGMLVETLAQVNVHGYLPAFLMLYGPGALGLLVSSLALRARGGSAWTFSPRAIAVSAVIAGSSLAALVFVTRADAPKPSDVSVILESLPAPLAARLVDSTDGFSLGPGGSGSFGNDHKARAIDSASFYATARPWDEIQHHYRAQFRLIGWIECGGERAGGALIFVKGEYLAALRYFPASKEYQLSVERGPRSGCRAPTFNP